jgi:hypothetical protein
MAIASSFQHIVLTRYFILFSNSQKDRELILKNSSTWLEKRFKLFDEYCLPSVVNQSVQNFIWLIYFDINTPRKYVEQVELRIKPYNNIKLILCDSFDYEAKNRFVQEEIDPNASWLLTTRLDNDDGWHRDFVKILQENVQIGRKECLNYPVGMILYSGKTFLYRHSSNAFISLSEPVDNFLTVLCERHDRLGRIAPVRQLPAFPAFMQVVHDGTRSNKPRGMRVPRLLGLVGFEAMTGISCRSGEEKDWPIAIYNVTRVPVWALRDWVIRLARGARSFLKRPFARSAGVIER